MLFYLEHLKMLSDFVIVCSEEQKKKLPLHGESVQIPHEYHQLAAICFMGGFVEFLISPTTYSSTSIDISSILLLTESSLRQILSFLFYIFLREHLFDDHHRTPLDKFTVRVGFFPWGKEQGNQIRRSKGEFALCFEAMRAQRPFF